MISHPARLVRDILTAKAGAVNALMKAFGHDIVDYATAILPDRGPQFEALLEDIFVDVIAQIRAADTATDESLRRFVFESATRTVRARHPQAINQQPSVPAGPAVYKHGDVLRALNMSEAQLAAAVSEGLIRAFREDDTTKFRAEDLRKMMKNAVSSLKSVSAMERELLCLHFRLGFAPEFVARWTSRTPAETEQKLEEACAALVKAGVISEALA